eukprot:TRINITY_DN1119_c0_g3_i2.p1 TRINITY_DN1119_c0_g3~~TRINITY_DN1119_c0_g3_i2.p1  ORF type:complete len:141 (-),score=7.93 TRINITY_DN1119_c0_g3_i2:342-764(-)
MSVCHSILETLKKNPLFSVASDLLLWTDIYRTFLIFSILNIYFFLITFGNYTVVDLSCKLFLSLLGACLGYIYIMPFLGKENPISDLAPVGDYQINRELLQEHVETVYSIWEIIRLFLRDIFYCSNALKSLTVTNNYVHI